MAIPEAKTSKRTATFLAIAANHQAARKELAQRFQSCLQPAAKSRPFAHIAITTLGPSSRLHRRPSARSGRTLRVRHTQLPRRASIIPAVSERQARGGDSQFRRNRLEGQEITAPQAPTETDKEGQRSRIGPFAWPGACRRKQRAVFRLRAGTDCPCFRGLRSVLEGRISVP